MVKDEQEKYLERKIDENLYGALFFLGGAMAVFGLFAFWPLTIVGLVCMAIAAIKVARL